MEKQFTLTADTLKSRHTCSILTKNNWSLTERSEAEIILSDLVHSAVCWLNKRGNHITWSSLEVTANYRVSKLPPDQATEVYFQLRRFYNDYYIHLDESMSRHPVEIQIDNSILTTDIPIVGIKDINYPKKRHVQLIFFENLTSKNLLMKHVSVRIASIWGGLTLGETVKVFNINPSNNTDLIEFEPTPHYINNSRKVLKSMLKSIATHDYYPPEEICGTCPHLTVCPM